MKKRGIPGIWIAIVVLYALAVIISPNFFSFAQVYNLMKVSTFLGVVAMGQTIVILTGGIDLSVANMLMAGNVISCLIMNNGRGSIAMAVIVPILLAIVVGCVNGLLITKVKLMPLIATLSTNYILYGGTLLMTNGVSKGGVDQRFTILSKGSLLNIFPIFFLIFLAITVILHIVLRKTRYGCQLYATGSNRVAAHVNGVNTTAVIIKAHVICAVLAAISGILLTAYIELPSFDIGTPYSTNSVASVVVGGTMMTGGIGGVVGTFGGVIFMTLLNSILNSLHISSGVQYVVRAVIIIIGICISQDTGRTGLIKRFLNRRTAPSGAGLPASNNK